LFFSLSAFAQLRERIEVNLVNVYLTATDSKGHFITDLKPEDFLLKENGVPQKITNFSNFSLDSNKEQLSVAFLMDVSRSMAEKFADRSRIQIAKDAALMVLNELHEQDEMAVIAFHQVPRILVDFTKNKKLVHDAIVSVQAMKAGTALYDSMQFSVSR